MNHFRSGAVIDAIYRTCIIHSIGLAYSSCIMISRGVLYGHSYTYGYYLFKCEPQSMSTGTECGG